MGFLPNGVIGVNISGDFVEMVRAERSLSGMNILRWKAGFFPNEKSVEDLLDDIGYDVEDTVVVNLPMDFIVFMPFDVAPGMKRKELKNYGNMMASRNLGLPAEDIAVDVVSVLRNKGMFVIAKKDNLEKKIGEIMSMGFPEPDIAIPDLLKYVYLITVPTVGELLMIVVNFLQNYMATVILSSGKMVSVRITTLELTAIFDAIQDQFGFTKEEMLMRTSVKDLGELYEFLKSSFENLAMELDRETRVALRDGLEQFDVSDMDMSVLFVEPVSLEEPLMDIMKETETFKELKKTPYRAGLNIPEGVALKIRGALGLLMRGGLEFGKVKSVRIKG